MHSRRKPLSMRHKEKLWREYYGSSLDATCYVCNISVISFTNCHLAHMIAKVKGGSDDASNLIPVCQSCNLSMRTQNLHDFKHDLDSFTPNINQVSRPFNNLERTKPEKKQNKNDKARMYIHVK